MRVLSVCSGIEAASVAWGPLGWKSVAFSEIEKFPSAVLAYHYPDVPNLGDFTKIDTSTLEQIDILCGGTPCQAFSVAGLRRSLADARGNLTLSFVRLAHELAGIAETDIGSEASGYVRSQRQLGNGLRNVVWEQVPGVLNTPDNAFGCFLGALVGADTPLPPPSGKRWPDAGMVSGPKGRAAWRIQDAQYHGLAQRRRRVLLVADFGNGADPAAVLFEWEGVRGNTPPSREAREGFTHPVAPSLVSSGRGVERAGDTRGQDPVVAVDIDGGYAPEIARCDATREGSSQDYETTTMVAVASIHADAVGRTGENATPGPDAEGRVRLRDAGLGIIDDGTTYNLTTGLPHAVCVTSTVTHTLKAEGFDASEDGTGRGQPIITFDTTQITSRTNRNNPQAGDTGHPLSAQAYPPAICFSSKDYGADASSDISPTLRAGGHTDSHANAGVPPAVALTVAIRGREGGATAELGSNVTTALAGPQGGGDKPHVLTSAVRRLTPVECERLMGFPDNHTRIPWRGKPAEECPDGPRYKALGNSWAVPKFRWLGERIARFMPPSKDNTNSERQDAA